MANKCSIKIIKSTLIKNTFISLLLALSAIIPSAAFAQSADNVKPAPEKHFTQTLSWQDDKNAFEYKVEIQPVETGGVKVEPLTLTTSNSSVSFSLPGGKYRYKIYAYDFLGRQASQTEWQNLEIIKAIQPEVAVTKKTVTVPKSSRKKDVVLDVKAEGITKDSKVVLKNTATNEEISGKLNFKGSGTKLAADSATFNARVDNGEWVVEVINPSGLSSVSSPFEIKIGPQSAADKAREEAEEAEKQAVLARLAEEEKEAKEAESREVVFKKPALDLQIMAGLSGYYNMSSTLLYGEDSAEDVTSSQKKSIGVPYASISFLPIKNYNWKLGFGASANLQSLVTKFEDSNKYASTEITIDLITLTLLYHRKLIKDRIYWAFNGGLSYVTVQKESKLYPSSSANGPLEYKFKYGYIAPTGGTSLFWIVAKHIAVEGGANFVYVSNDDGDLIMVNPFVSMGLRF